MKRVIVMFCMFLCLSVGVFAQDKAKEEGAVFPVPKALDNSFINWMVGEWEGWSESPMGKTTDYVAYKLGLDNQFLIITYEGKGAKSSYKGRGAITLTPEGGVTGFWIDNMRTMSTGKGKIEGTKLTMEWSTPGAGQGKRITEKINHDKFVVSETWNMPDGKVMENRSEMTRVKQAAKK